MKMLFWKDGRFAWPPIVAAAICVFALLLADYVWRMSNVSGSAVMAAWVVVAGLSIAAVVADGLRQRR